MLALKNPFIAAAGTCGLIYDAPPVMKLHLFGAVVAKTITAAAREGNPPPRVWETPCGIVNSVGLENPGVEAFLNEHLPRISLPKDVQLWLSAGGESADEIVFVCRQFAKAKERFSAVELNLSCPNISGEPLCADKDAVRNAVKGAKDALGGIKVFAKLSPLGDTESVAETALNAGADGLVVANTLPALVLDENMQPALGGVFGGLSGAAVRPIILRLVYRLWRRFGCWIIASGGVSCGRDAAEFIAAGAAAVQIGSANLSEPGSVERIIAEFNTELARLGVNAERLHAAAHIKEHRGGC